MSDPQVDILIIGGGFSGTMLAVHLLRHTSLCIGVVDRGALPGRGLAYGSPHQFHLLNVPAGEMSAWPGAPDDFLRWARTHYDASLQARSFPPRSVYGAYLGSVLESTLDEFGNERFQWIRDEARSLHRRKGRLAVQTNQGTELPASVVVLATGNFPPANPRLPGLKTSASLYFQFAWAKNVLEELPTTGSVLLLGSGLTSVDLIMALKSKGFRGVIHVLSHKGLFPRPRRQQRPDEPWPLFWDETSPRTVRGLLRLIRNQVRAAATQGINWRAVIDSLRPVTQEIWRSLPIEEQKRFVRHARAYWDVHRHRVAPEIADLLDDMRSDGLVQLHTGTVTQYSERDHRAEVHYWDRRTRTEKTLRVDRVINCSGSETDCRRIDESFITSLVVQGFARPDRLFLGVDVNEQGALIDYKGTPSHRLYAIGPVRKGCFWETTAVPEIRVQAATLAEHLADMFRRSNRRPGRALKTA
ncbi:MAG: FAD/NAD(P)-binding protein [Candidatus Sulfotelmatobacter sp.]